MFRLFFVLHLLATLSAAVRMGRGSPSCPSDSITNVSGFTLTAIAQDDPTITVPLFVVIEKKEFSYLVS
jgi:hypothetical protein